MTTGFAGTERYDATSHDVTGFSCGNELLDRWLVRYAGQNQRRNAARTFVAVTTNQRVYGYYTLLAGQLDHHEATVETSKGLSQHFPIPVAILARLAVDVGQQGGGIGAALLNDALVRVVRASEEVAVRAWSAGLSQEALAGAAHLHITVLGDVERGVDNPEYATLVKLAHALGVTPGVLVSRADELSAHGTGRATAD